MVLIFSAKISVFLANNIIIVINDIIVSIASFTPLAVNVPVLAPPMAPNNAPIIVPISIIKLVPANDKFTVIANKNALPTVPPTAPPTALENSAPLPNFSENPPTTAPTTTPPITVIPIIPPPTIPPITVPNVDPNADPAIDPIMFDIISDFFAVNLTLCRGTAFDCFGTGGLTVEGWGLALAFGCFALAATIGGRGCAIGVSISVCGDVSITGCVRTLDIGGDFC